MLTAILTTSGQNSSAFRRKEKSSETKQQKIESNGWFRLASISCCCCRWRASARCRRTCAERDLQNVTYHNNCYEKKFSEKIHLFIRSPNKRQYLPRSSEIFRTTTSRKMRDFRLVKKFLVFLSVWSEAAKTLIGEPSPAQRKGPTTLTEASEKTLTLVQLLIRINSCQPNLTIMRRISSLYMQMLLRREYTL